MFEIQKKILKEKIEKANICIDECLEKSKNPYVAFSGGKDSLVVLHLVIQKKPDVAVVHIDAECDYPETTECINECVKRWNLNFINFKTDMPFLEILKKYGILPVGAGQIFMKKVVYEPIRKVIKQYNFDGVFLGVRAKESVPRCILLRNKSKIFFNNRDNVWQFLPIGWWTTDDVWNYIEAFELPYNKVYDNAIWQKREDVRVSYWAGGENKRTGRFAYLKYYYPELFNKLYEVCKEARNFD